MVNTRKTALWGVLTIAASGDAFWRMSCSLIQTGRVDPIVNPGRVSGHVHKVSGASNFGINPSYDDLMASKCSSCEVQDDKSAYWTPQLYYQHANGSFQMVPNGGTIVYYLGRGENRDNIEPFPPGFKMLAGDNGARSFDSTTMTYGTAQKPGRPLAERVSFACLDSSGGMPEQNYMFRTDCNNGMRAQIHFPSCWNGGDYRPDQGHVAYMSKIDNGVCPPTHPRLLPHLFIEIIYGVNDIDKSNGGKFVFANGDTTGYSFHGDFMNGWDTGVLEDAIKQCINNDSTGGSVAACPPLAKSQTPYFSTNCPERPPIFNETVRGMLKKLPGCNPVTSGPERAQQQVCDVEPDLIDYGNGTSDATINPNVGDKIGTWAYVGCAAEGSTRTLNKYSISSNSMTIDACIAACKSQELSLAGLENSRECYCSDALTKGASYMTTDKCTAAPKMICAGNQTQWCGAPGMLTVWNDTSYVPPQPLVIGSTKIASGSGTYHGCWSEPANGRALSSDRFADATGMTNEKCVAYCKEGGYQYAGTEYASECYCGDTIGGTNIADISQCSMKCKGDIMSYCGAGSRLSVWKIAQPPKSTTPPTYRDADYLGCYTDGGAGGRTLPSASFSGASVSIDTCSAFCKKGNYPLFGMEYGQQCYCGYATKPEATLANEADCKMTCAGNSSQICGAGSRISVWQNNGISAPSAPARVNAAAANKEYEYVACYTEATSGRALELARTSDGTKMTVEMCADFCAAKGYSYMGVEYGQECYCNNNGPSGGSKTAVESDCNMICKGDSSQYCGGGSRLNVYKMANAAAAKPALKAAVVNVKTSSTSPTSKKTTSTTSKKSTSTTSKKTTTTPGVQAVKVNALNVAKTTSKAQVKSSSKVAAAAARGKATSTSKAPAAKNTAQKAFNINVADVGKSTSKAAAPKPPAKTTPKPTPKVTEKTTLKPSVQVVPKSKSTLVLKVKVAAAAPLTSTESVAKTTSKTPIETVKSATPSRSSQLTSSTTIKTSSTSPSQRPATSSDANAAMRMNIEGFDMDSLTISLEDDVDHKTIYILFHLESMDDIEYLTNKHAKRNFFNLNIHNTFNYDFLDHGFLSHNVFNYNLLKYNVFSDGFFAYDFLNHKVLRYEYLGYDFFNHNSFAYDVLSHDLLSCNVLGYNLFIYDFFRHNILGYNVLGYNFLSDEFFNDFRPVDSLFIYDNM